MKINVTTGTWCFPPSGSLAVPCPVWRELAVMQGAMSAACRSHGHRAAATGSRSPYRGRFRTFTNTFIDPIGINLPVAVLMHTSASEP